MNKNYCFTLDDNIRFLEDICAHGYSSIFQTPYLAMLQRFHKQFGCKFQLNMFYSYAPGKFSLADVPHYYRKEFEKNSSWLKFSFHARYNDPPFPYAENDQALLRDYLEVTGELLRIAGADSIAATTTLHYAAATEKGCALLQKFGVHGLIGMFYDLSGKDALHYYLPASKWPSLRSGQFYDDPHTKLRFAHNDLILNQHNIASLTMELEHINSLVGSGKHAGFLQVMTHEQYFYADYVDYQPNYEKKMLFVLDFLARRGYTSVFLEQTIV